MKTINLNGVWRVRAMPFACEGAVGYRRMKRVHDGWLPARVPGEIHLDLMRAGKMEEPLFSVNAPKCRWPETKSWWWRRTFRVSASVLAHERVRLIFDGLDFNAQVFLNGRLIGTSRNAFVPAVFDLKRHPMDRELPLRAGNNELVVRLTAGTELAQNDQFNTVPKPGVIPNPFHADNPQGHRNWPARRWLRKPQFEYGWDWAEALPNIGIWRGVRLEAKSHVVLADLRVDPIHEGGRWFAECEAMVENLHPWSERACTFELRLDPPAGKAEVHHVALSLAPGQAPVRFRIPITSPEVWWPNGMGAQPLYGVTARVLNGDSECDGRTFRIGLRTVEVDRSPLKEGSRFCITVNGREVFCRGGNWVPADSILARVTPRKYRALVAEARGANMNMLRVWGGGIYEDPVFYDACDEAGILVWQDFMYACTTYHDHLPEFREVVRAETEAVVKALRHHPALALWSGNNENIQAFCEWLNNDPQKPVELGGSAIYNQILPEICRLHDPRRPYWPSSPCGGEKPNSQTVGDCHWWYLGVPDAEPAQRVRHEVFDRCRARFISEYGAAGPLNRASFEACLKPGEMKPGSVAWTMHTNGFGKLTLEHAIRLHYADPEGLPLDQFILYGQLFQAMMYEKSIEAFRFRKHDPVDDCAGALIWMYNDCWGETGWTIVDYWLRRKASYYGFRRAAAPVKVIVRARGKRLVVRTVNDTLAVVRGTVEYGWFRVDGTERRTWKRRIMIPADSMAEVANDPIPSSGRLDPREWIYAAVLDTGDVQDQCVYPLVPHRQLTAAQADLRVRTKGRQAVVVSPVFRHSVHVQEGGRLLLDDNYFDLLPGVPRRVTVLQGQPEALEKSTALIHVPY